MRAKATKININHHAVNIDRDEINIEDETILDIVGTGGDGTRTFNVSTTTAFVAAGGGIKVAKHGNRAVSSLCGSADVLESLNVNLDLTSTDVENCISQIGIGFLYAPLFHGAMKYAAGPRREIGIRSIFNLLGPVTNPAGASAQVLGVYEAGLTDKIALVLKRLGTREAFVVCGEGTYDEISICGPTKVSHLKDGEVRTFQMTPEEYNLKRADCEDIVGGDAAENAKITRSILDGDKGPRRDMVLLNASAAFVASGICGNISEGIQIAADAIDSGNARQKLDNLIDFTQQCQPYIRKAF
jgi:anthranilate phosphoribosyltransferase